MSLASILALALTVTAAGQAPKFPVGAVFSSTAPDNSTIALSFDSTGTLDVYVNNQAFGKSTWQVKADTMTFGPVTGPEGYACASTARYLWSITEDSLTFKVVGADDCSPRLDPLNTLVWKRG